MKKYLLPFILSLLAITGTAYASTISNTPNLFETYLANSEGSTDTSFVLASNTLRDGSSLSGYTCFTIDSNTSIVEYECGTVNGVFVTNVQRGIHAVTGTTTITSLQYAHHRGADVKVTDYPTLTILSRIFQAVDGIAQPIMYDAGVATSTIAGNRQNLADWGLVQDTALQGSGAIAATTAAKGYVQIATGLQAASSTAVGSTGATVVLPASLATSTYNAATAPLKVVVTNNLGTIDPGFLPSSIATTTTVATYPIMQIFQQRQIFSSTGTTTFSVPANVGTFNVQTIAGGGNGGTASACGGSTNFSAGGGGGGGGYANKNVNLIGTTTVQVFVGAQGQWSTFGTNGFYEYSTSGANASNATPGQGGTGVNGDFNLQGQGGMGGFSAAAWGAGVPSGIGGSSFMGGGASSVTGGNTAGNNGNNYGGGASGSVCTNNVSPQSGGTGAQGLVIVSW